MKCEDFRRCNEGGVEGILALTRAERSACAQHWVECFECRDWTNTFSLALTPDQKIRTLLCKAEDERDPETYKLPPGEANKFDLDERRKCNDRRPTT